MRSPLFRLPSFFVPAFASLFTVAFATSFISGCKEKRDEAKSGIERAVAPLAKPTGKPVLLVSQAQFDRSGGGFKPGPAKLTLLRPKGDSFATEVIEDSDSNVFHKAMVFEGGILTIGGEKAMLKLWKKPAPDALYEAETIWSKSWGGKFNRLRDVEIGDVTGDGEPNLVIATHDQGVIAIGSRTAGGSESNKAGSWAFEELGQAADTFVHEIELGDLDGNGALEIYATPSGRNRSDGTSQNGKVVSITKTDSGWVTKVVVEWPHSHAKEILVAKMGRASGPKNTDTLFVVREGHVEKSADGLAIKDPVTITQHSVGNDGAYKSTSVATIEDRQARFALASDINLDGKMDLVVSAMNSGLFLVELGEDGRYSIESIDTESGGFEHAILAADLDEDGEDELFVAADREKQIRRYRFIDGGFSRKTIYEIPPDHITWNLQAGLL